MAQVDAENLPLVRTIVTTHGYPGAGQIGRNGVAALFFLVQHAAQDQNLMKRVLRLADPLEVATYRRSISHCSTTGCILNHEEQIYGTQTGQDRNGWFMYPISLPSEVDQRRKAMSMAPLDFDRLPPQRWPAPSLHK